MASFFVVLAPYLQQGRGLNALQAGLVFTILAGAYLVTSLRAPALTVRYGRRLIAVGALTLASAYALLLVGVVFGGADTWVLELVPGLLFAGGGMGLCITPLVATVLSSVQPEQAGAASGTLSTVQQLGNALGVAGSGVLFFCALNSGYTYAFAITLGGIRCFAPGGGMLDAALAAEGSRMSDGLLAIGMFSRASFLSIKMLRAYHEAGILVPAEVDRFAGYRMYTVDQLADAAIVRRLRALDLPLDRVREVVQARDPEFTREVLAVHQVVMQARLEETEHIVAELQSSAAPVTHTSVHVRQEPAMHTLAVRGKVKAADLGDWAVSVFEHLFAVAERAEVPLASGPGMLYDPQIEDDEGEAVEAFVPISQPIAVPRSERDISLGEIPAVHAAVLMHSGDYDAMLDTYRVLAAWVARHAEPSGERIREWHRVAPWDTDDVGAYRTEISWPITPQPTH
jgi:DNA-binding transcriptional MerR regulator